MSSQRPLFFEDISDFVCWTNLAHRTTPSNAQGFFKTKRACTEIGLGTVYTWLLQTVLASRSFSARRQSISLSYFSRHCWNYLAEQTLYRGQLITNITTFTRIGVQKLVSEQYVTGAYKSVPQYYTCVRCNCVRHAKSAPDTFAYMQSCPGLCKNRPVDMYMTVHVCARVSERAHTEPT